MRYLLPLLIFLSSRTYAQQWQLIEVMPNARAAFAMSQISSDTLILIGGRNSSGVTKACDLFSLSKQNWISTAALNVARQNMPSVLLGDGNVYVPSGLANLTDEMTKTSEIYDRNTRQWSYTIDVLEAREGNPAILLPNGKVLIPAGALAPNGPYRNTCELYDPITKSQTFTGSITTGQFGNIVFLSGDSIVVLVSDHYNGASGTWVNETEEYNIATGQWKLAARSQEPHGCWMDQALQLPNGEIVAPSGGKAPNTASALVEIYNPQTKTWREAGSLPHPRYLATTVFLGGDSIMVIGGFEPSTGKALRECTIFNIATGASRNGPLLNERRYFHRSAVVRKPDIENPCCEELKIFVFGGEDETGKALASSEVLILKSAAESPLAFTPSLTLEGSICDDIDTVIAFKNIGCSSIIVDSVKAEDFNATVSRFPLIVKLDDEANIPLSISSDVAGSVSGKVRIYYRTGCSRLDTSIAITASFATSSKGTIRPIISDVPNGRDTVEMPLYLVNNSGDIFNAFEIVLGYNKNLLEAIQPRFDGTLAEGAPLADVTSTAAGATVFVPQTISLSVSKPLCTLRYVSRLSDTTCTTVRLEEVRLEDANGNSCIYAVRKDSALICKTLAVDSDNKGPSCAPYITELLYDRSTSILRFTVNACTNDASVELYDILGKQLYSTITSTASPQWLQTIELPRGVYSFVVRNSYGASMEKLMVIQ